MMVYNSNIIPFTIETGCKISKSCNTARVDNKATTWQQFGDKNKKVVSIIVNILNTKSWTVYISNY